MALRYLINNRSGLLFAIFPRPGAHWLHRGIDRLSGIKEVMVSLSVNAITNLGASAEHELRVDTFPGRNVLWRTFCPRLVKELVYLKKKLYYLSMWKIDEP